MASNCQVPTPHKYVQDMLSYVDYTENLYGKKILENSCGDGNILIEIVERYIKDSILRKYSVDEIKKGLHCDVIAYEIDEECIINCKNRLNELTASYGIKSVEWNIRHEDFLKEIIEERFDYIVGNPPYITYHDMTDEQRSLLKEKFKTCEHGRSDYFYAFIEKSINVLNDGGKMIYLVPYSVMTNKFARELRKFIKSYITMIYDYRTIKIFPEALTSSVMLKCEKTGQHEEFKYHLIAEHRSLEVPKSKLGNKWIILGHQNVDGIRFGDYFEVRNSVATLLNEAFVLGKYEYQKPYYIVGNYKIEEDLIREAASTKSYNKKDKMDKIIFPYKSDNGQREDYTEEEFREKFPEATQYLLQFSEKLKKRKADQKAFWFQYGRSQAVTKIFGEKLIIPMVITKKIHVYEAGADAVPYAGYFIKSCEEEKLNLQKAKEILESPGFYEYVKICGTPTTPTSYRISVDDIKDYMIDKDYIWEE